MIIGNTIFEHKDIHKYTWTKPGGDTKKQIDHILVNSTWIKSLLDIQTYRGADIGSDHELVIAKVRLRLYSKWKKEEKSQKTTAEYLTDESKKLELENTLRTILSEQSNVTDS